MLDFSFSELLLCLVIALVVLGPERMPVVARTVGRWAGQAKGYLRNLTAELDRETRASDLRKQLEEAQRQLREQARDLEKGAQTLGRDVKSPPPTGTPPADKPPGNSA